MSARWLARLAGVDDLRRAIASLGERVGGLESGMSAQAERIGQNREALDAARHDIDELGRQLRERMHGIDRRMDGALDAVAAAEARMGEIMEADEDLREEIARVDVTIGRLDHQARFQAEETEKVSRGLLERLLRIERG